ncbi:MAG: calcium-binding protein, partial [Neisseriales bacterium]
MSTYQDKQQLAQFVYDKLSDIPKDTKTWTRVDGLYTVEDTSNGYYGAVYTNGKGEYILVSRGTDNFTNKVHDAGMAILDDVPPEFTDAYELAAKATAYVHEHGGTLSFDGHSLGGTISQLLAITFSGEATAFNPYNSRNFLDSVERVDQSIMTSLINRKNELQQQVDNGELGSQPDLDTVNQQLIKIEANNKLYDAWHGGSQYDITNYRIENDLVSGAGSIQKDQLGETITITYESKGDAKLMGANEYIKRGGVLDAKNDFSADIETFHGIGNFSKEQLLAETGNIYISTNKGSLDDPQELGLVELFKDKTKYEIDALDATHSKVRINQEHEFFFGVVNYRGDWQRTGDDRTQLITEKYDQIYNKVNLATVGTAEEVAAARQKTIDFMLSQKYADGSAVYGIKHDEINADKQIYVLFERLEPKKKHQQYDPLALDLNGSGKVETVGLSAGVLFDHDADGVKTGTGWVASGDGLVVRDINKNGQIDSGREIFGDNTILSNGQKAKDAFEAIADLDANKDGKVDAKDAAFSELKVWQDKNQNGISEASELKTLTELGITSISTQASITGMQNSANGNVEIGFSSFERADGSTGNSGAFNFVGNPVNSEFTDTVDTSLVMDIPNISGSGMVRNLREASALSTDLASAVRNYINKDYPSDVDLEIIVALWAQTGQMDTIASTLKTGAHPADGRGTNLTTEEINKLSVLEKFTGLYAATADFTDPMDSVDGKIDGRYSGSFYGVNMDANSINNSYNSLKIDIEKDLALVSGKTSIFNLVDYKLQDNKVILDFTCVYQWVTSLSKPEAFSQMLKLYNNIKLEQSELFTAESQNVMNKWIVDALISNDANLSTLNSQDVTLGSDTNDTIWGSSSATNTIYGMSGDDIIYGSGDNNILDGGDGNDKLYAGYGVNVLIGGAGHDYLSNERGSSFGNNVFWGGTGSDTIVAGSGKDVFIFNRGDGKDTIFTYGVGDVLRFGKGITLNDLSFLSYGSSDLIMNIGDSGIDGIMIKNVYSGMYTSSQNIVEYLEFYDGTRIKTSEAVAQRFGNEKNEIIIGFDADEVYYAKGGNDYVKGMNGNDFIDGGSGNDSLYGGNGNDIIIGGLGSDTIYGDDGDDVLNGNEENDILFGGSGDDTIYGGSGNDSIDGNEGRNYLFGEDGDDVIKTTTSSSQPLLMSTTFNGGRGNDYLQGSYAGDIYVFNRGDGQDIINDLGEGANLFGNQYDNKYGKLLDVIEFGAGITKDELIFKRVNNDLLIQVGLTGSDSLTIKDHFINVNRQIELLVFADGSKLDKADLQQIALSYFGSDASDSISGWNGKDNIVAKGGDDKIYANAGDDFIDAGTGNDYVEGGAGNDNILGMDGNDVIYAQDGNDFVEGGSGNDKIYGGSGDNILKGGSGDDYIEVSNTEIYGDNRGIAWSQLGYKDGQNILEGGTGNDLIVGGWGGDTYIYNLGDGNDTIIEPVKYNYFEESSEASAQSDKLAFGAGINQDNLSFARINNDLVININSVDSGSIKIKSWYSDVGRQIEELHFADGSVLTSQYILDLNLLKQDAIESNVGKSLVEVLAGWNGKDDLSISSDGNVYKFGGDGDDTLSGGTGNDFLNGGEGNDVITDASGNNTFSGGKGNDYIQGARGNTVDQYLFNMGDGHDVIVDNYNFESNNIVENKLIFGSGIKKEDVYLARNGMWNFTVKFAGNSNDSIELQESHTWGVGMPCIDKFVFSDGTVVNLNQIPLFVHLDEANLNYENEYLNNHTEQYTTGGITANISIQENYLHQYVVGTDQANVISMRGTAMNMTVDSGAGNDTIWTSPDIDGGKVTVFAGSGNDEIISATGATFERIVKGGTGDDTISSKSYASDTYLFDIGDGHDTITEWGDSKRFLLDQKWLPQSLVDSLGDVIQFGVGITQDDLSFIRVDNNLVINIGINGTDSMTIKDHFRDSNAQIELIIFSDGTKLTKDEYLKNLSVNLIGTESNDILTSAGGNDSIIANGGNDTITSGAGRDTIDAGSGDDTINAGTGNDTIAGGSGNDTYIYKAGDGQDIISDIAGTDTLNLQSIQISALKFTQDNNDLLINFTNSSTDAIRVSEWFSSADNRIEQLKLDDGSILDLNNAVEAQLITKYGTSANDILELTAAKTQVIAGTGNDTITDVTANNTIYIFNKGDGKDTIIESNSSTDTIQLNNITPQEISYSKIDNDLIINLGADDSITIKDFTNRANRIENISFNNGMTMLLAEALAAAKVFGNDKTVTSNGDDNLWLEQGAKINLREGNNQAYINSNGIATTVTSGAGNDNVEVYDNANVTLSLGNGNNSVLVKDGNHVITTGIGSDTVTLGAGVSSLNVGDGNDNVTITKTQANSSFSVSLGAGNDSLKVNGAGGAIKVSNSSGDDIFNLANINTQISASAGNNLINLDNSGLTGDVNSISLAAGDDQLTVKSSGQTTIRAGEGTNQINLGGGGSFSVSAGSGDDQVTIQDLANSTLSLGNGNNTIMAQDGKHVITTGTGNDNVTLGAGIASNINVGDGNDNVTITKTQTNSSFSVSLGAGNDSLKVNGAGGAIKVSNLSGDDTFNLANINTQISASAGNNLINLDNSGLTGDTNSISLAAGNDQLTVKSSGQTTIYVGEGINQINLGGGGSFIVSAGSGDDQVKIQDLANSTLSLGNGNNTISAQDGNHRITTGIGNDNITIGGGISTISSGDGDDNVTITTTQNTSKYTINLGAGNDSLNFNGNGGELAQISSSSGNDQINISNIRSQITLSSGDNTVNLNNSQLSGESNAINTGTGNDTIAVNSNGINTINASNGTNQITLSGNSSNTVTSGSGNDVIRSNAGSLTLNSGAGDDVLEITSNQAQDKFALNMGDGNDSVKLQATGAATTIANNYGDDSYELTGTQVK